LVAAIVSLFFNLEAVSIFVSAYFDYEIFPTDLVANQTSGETLQVRISWDEYRDKIVDYGHIKIFAMASVQETKQSWSEEDDFQLEKPKLDVQVAFLSVTVVTVVTSYAALLINIKICFRSEETRRWVRIASLRSVS
jgi:hypothetical protein